MNVELESHLIEICESYSITKEYVMKNDEEMLDEIEEAPPLAQLAFLEALEDGLKEQQKVFTESVFESEYSRALNLYRKICKDHNIEIEL